MKLSTLQARFDQWERRRLAAARAYTLAYGRYQRARTPEIRYARYHNEVIPSYHKLLDVTELRNKAADKFNAAARQQEAIREGFDSAVREWEMTAVTAGGSPRRDKAGQVDPQRLHLKMRIGTDREMSPATVRGLVERAVQSGVIPPGISVRWIDWRKGDGGRAQSGQVLPGEIRRAFRRFHGAMTQGDVRLAPVKD